MCKIMCAVLCVLVLMSGYGCCPYYKNDHFGAVSYYEVAPDRTLELGTMVDTNGYNFNGSHLNLRLEKIAKCIEEVQETLPEEMPITYQDRFGCKSRVWRNVSVALDQVSIVLVSPVESDFILRDMTTPVPGDEQYCAKRNRKDTECQTCRYDTYVQGGDVMVVPKEPAGKMNLESLIQIHTGCWDVAGSPFDHCRKL